MTIRAGSGGTRVTSILSGVTAAFLPVGEMGVAAVAVSGGAVAGPEIDGPAGFINPIAAVFAGASGLSATARLLASATVAFAGSSSFGNQEYLLLNTGFYLLLETGGRLILSGGASTISMLDVQLAGIGILSANVAVRSTPNPENLIVDQVRIKRDDHARYKYS